MHGWKNPAMTFTMSKNSKSKLFETHMIQITKTHTLALREPPEAAFTPAKPHLSNLSCLQFIRV